MTSKPTEKSLKIEIRKGDSPEITQLLKKTVFGTQGKTRYRQNHIDERIKATNNIEFIQIKKGNHLLGTAGVIHRKTHIASDNFNSLYVRYLSMWNPFRKQKGNRPSFAKRSNSDLRKELGEMIISHFEKPISDRNEQAAFYAFVESENLNSKELCMSLGFHPKRKVATLLYSRFFPKRSSRVIETDQDLHDEIRGKLLTFYRDHSFYFEDQLFEQGAYYVFTKDDKIMAGLRAIPVNWEIVEVPGWKGLLMQKVLPYLPLTSRLFSPGNLNFLTFDYFWHVDGYENSLYELMDHASHEADIHTGMLWCDIESDLYSEFTRSGKLGFLHKVNGPVNADVMIRFINSDSDAQKKLLNRPVFVSALDMS